MYTVSVFVLYHITSFHGLTHWLVSVWDWCVESCPFHNCQIDWKISRIVLLFDGCILGPSWTPERNTPSQRRSSSSRSCSELGVKRRQFPKNPRIRSELKPKLKPFKQHMKPSFSFALRSATFWLIPEIVCETVSSTSQRATNLAHNVAGYAAMSCSFCEGLRFAHRFWIVRKFGRTIQGFIVH